MPLGTNRAMVLIYLSGHFPSLCWEKTDPLQCLSANWLNNRFSAADFQLGDGGPDIWLCGGYWTLAVGPESNALDVLLESDLRTLVAQGEGYRSISVFIEILNAGFSVGCVFVLPLTSPDYKYATGGGSYWIGLSCETT
ncbi:hypothetical protein SDJN02_07719, partial [Cucurbita argyrosperma subsp. argyrosperma]